jgi:hypothetical protein
MHAQYLEMLALKVRLDYGFMMYWIKEMVLHWRQNVDGASKQWLGGQRQRRRVIGPGQLIVIPAVASTAEIESAVTLYSTL